MITPPVATYRLQLGPGLSFAGARGLVPYLRELGVSHLYLSPVTQALEGSSHGYDVVDPCAVSTELGGEGEFRKLCRAGLGVLLDVVPNHMLAGEENRFWRDPEWRGKTFDLDRATGRHRRFFDIEVLAGVRVEDGEVFDATHELILRLVGEGLVDGVRVDHVDGLADPRGYLERLRAQGVDHVWVEKILAPGEVLRDWALEGTTGYEFASDVQALFVDPAGEQALTELTREQRSYPELVFEAKLEQAETIFQPEVDRLRRLLDVPDLERALASLPVYRTYVEPWSGRVEAVDRAAVDGLPERLRRVLLLEERGHDEFVTRFQQTTVGVMAKGVEDTALYRHVRLLALNEVGGDPTRFGLSVEAFHRSNLERLERFPNALLAGTTHDTKRSADVRARIGVLAGMAETWSDRVIRWRTLNEPLHTGFAPDWTEELLIYQTLVGAWPISAERLTAYVTKALREAKRHSSWVAPSESGEAAVAGFCAGLYEHQAFLSDLEPFAEEVAAAGERSAIGQLVLRLTSPGIPDIYNGDELWFLRLVDPDNRPVIDWQRRRDLLSSLKAAAPDRETVKLFVIRESLKLRRRHPEAFARAYEPVPGPPTTCAFRRGDDVLVAVPVRGNEPEFEAPIGQWRDILAGIESALGGYRPRLLERIR